MVHRLIRLTAWVAIILVIAGLAGEVFATEILLPEKELPAKELNALLQKAESLEYSNPNEAKALYQEVLAKADELADIHFKILGLNGIASCMGRTGNNVEALSIFQQALDLALNLEDDQLLSDVRISLGASYFDMGDYEQALSNFQASLKLREKSGDKERIAKSMTNIGNVYWMMDDYQRAIDAYKGALASFQSLDFELGVAGISINLGEGELKLGKPELALEKFRVALRLFERLKNPFGAAMAHEAIGRTYSQQGNYESAVKEQVKALEMRMTLEDKKGQTTSLIALARAFISLHSHSKAESALNRALKLATDNKLLQEEQEIYLAFANLYESRGQSTRALKSFQKHIALRDKLYRGKTEQNVREMQARFQVRGKMEELRFQTKLSGVQLLHAKSERNLWIVLALITGMLGAVSLILYRQKIHANQELDKLARRDPLTGLSNRRDITSVIETEIMRARRCGIPFSVLLLDVDHFKEINDRFGHTVGDSLLIWLAHRIRENLRQTDRGARWGGEEFLIFLADTNLTGAAQSAERLQAAMADSPYQSGGQPVNMTVTIGVATFDRERDLSLNDLVLRADHALYRGKEEGRNRIVMDQYKT